MATIDGTDAGETLRGTDGDDVINALGGNDTIVGGLGVDRLYGGDGDDLIRFEAIGISSQQTPVGLIDGGAGADTLDFRLVRPVILGTIQNAGNAYVLGAHVGSQRYEIANIETILFGDGSDYISVIPGFSGAIELRGGGGNDEFTVEGNGSFYGEGGDDSFFLSGSFGTARNGLVDGGTGIDTLKLNIAFTVDLAAQTAIAGDARFTVARFETVLAAAVSGYLTTVSGSDAAETFGVNTLFDDGSVGVVLDGRGGADVLTGSIAGDRLSGGDGNDVLTGRGGADTLTGGAGNDIFRDTAAGLNGDTITDFGLGDRIAITGTSSQTQFQFALSGTTLSYTGGALTLAAGIPTGYHLIAVPDTRGGTELRLSADPLELSRSDALVVNEGSLAGSPAVRIVATGVSFSNSAAGRVVGEGNFPAIVFDAGGGTVFNQSGGVIRTEAEYSGLAIRGSEGSDTVVNAGLLAGGTSLLGGADTFVFQDGGIANFIDLGTGDDTFQYEGSSISAPTVTGGEGIDTVVIKSKDGATGSGLTGFERLVLQSGYNIFNFSGYQSIDLVGQQAGLSASRNPLVDLKLDGQSISVHNGSSLRSITGGAKTDNVTLGARATVGDVSLGAGDDTFNFDLLYPDAPPVFGTVDGGAGIDGINISLGEGQTLTLDLARLTGFETVSANGWYGHTTNINLSNVVAPVSILAGTKANLTLDNSSTALLRGGFGGSIVLNAGVVVGRYGMPTEGPYNSSVDLVQADDRLSLRLVNHAVVQGDIKFYTGDDVYDGRDGTVGGTIYGNAGNDTILGGDGVERMIGGAGRDILSGGGGDDVLTGSADIDTLTGGAGADVFRDTAAGLNGDTITDIALGDRIVISDAKLIGFQFSVSGNTLSYTGGALTLSGGVPAGYRVSAAAGASGGVELSLVAAGIIQDDFNGDGRSDIVWRNDNGALTNWLGQANGGFALNDATAYAQVPLAWKVASVGDFNGDGRSDVLWRNDNGALTNWLGQPAGGLALNDGAAYAQVALDWKVAGVGDFNGDGRSDVLWRNDNGALTNWLGQTNGGFAINSAAYTTAPTSWKVAGVGDFNGDGRDDIVWRNDNGALTNWLGQAGGGFAINDAAAYTTVPTSWRVAGVGDFNGDGRDDIVWRNDNGALTNWLGQVGGGFAINDATAYTAVSNAWKVAGVGDYNGDGRYDILWRNDNGALTDWLGQTNGGFAINDAAAYTTVPNAWKVADTRPLLGAPTAGAAGDGIAALRSAFAPEHVTVDDVAVLAVSTPYADHTLVLLSDTLW